MADEEGPVKYALITKNGYPLDEVASALQKCIRRGWEDQALFWALELAEGFDEYLWKRLMVIASEDIGIADNFAAVLVQSLYQSAQVVGSKPKKNELKDYLQISHAVLYMCRTQKTRYVDLLGCYVIERRRQGWRPEVPEVAVDCHTARGRGMGKSGIDFCREGSALSNEVEITGPKYKALVCTVCGTLPSCSEGQKYVSTLEASEEAAMPREPENRAQ